MTSSVKENWGKLTDVDLVEISGKREQLTSKIQTIYGITRREADKQVWDWGKGSRANTKENCLKSEDLADSERFRYVKDGNAARCKSKI